ncbi:DUF6177 family protein [Streptomyces flavofungini]|uniref:Uncharacterized protein n=1 Tax=Streptomyces flavofungini TaxID=68200 RepID=A0ABS0X6L4_9ACTN|nr:DUF6177 family protein [Streptomyces flavofungini]MBJ3808843.1 hypothetical protein [Streptomyces flavofungini]GHC48915.1 hypothetical protein GCM10010349_12910 [Streptomyces flavofungini]
MTKDVIALTPEMPDAMALLAGLHAGGPELSVHSLAEGAVVQLRTPDGRPLVSVEAPVLVQTPGEAQRLLDSQVEAPDVPFWWTEVRASTAVAEAADLAGSFCGRLTLLLGGTTWPPEAATVGVVHTAEGPTGEEAGPEPEGALPAVDILTDSTAVVLADRPVVALTAWLSEVLRATADAGRALHIVTPSRSRLSLSLRTALTGPPNRWVVQAPQGGYYDGLSGAVLHWRDGTFTPALDDDGETVAAKGFTPPAPPSEQQLTLSVRTHHTPDSDLVLGRSLETAWHHLTGAAPAGWGTAEPVNLPWSRRQLTALARDRAPAPSHLLAVGHPGRPAIASLRVSRTKSGVAEEASLTLGYTADESPPLDTLETLAGALASEHGLSTLLITLRRSRHDLTVPAHLEGPPIPVSFTLGAADVQAVGLDHARRPPLPQPPTSLGLTAAPALHYRLSDGTSPDAWTDLEALSRHLRNA